MSVSEAATFFRSQPRIQNRFQMLKQIGLDYVVLGQPSETLSGGEAQRLKLAARLSGPNRGPCLILCDEPTNGLHPADVGRLLIGFRELIANGHSLILADNSPELAAAADDIIELRRNEQRGDRRGIRRESRKNGLSFFPTLPISLPSLDRRLSGDCR